MIITKPNYYDEFHCIASNCPDTCCAGWQIMIDANTLEKYRTTKGAFGNRLHNSINWRQSCFLQYDRNCSFLNEEHLCDIYQEEGADCLCDTCRTYPRSEEIYPNEREKYLTISCPEVARIILSFRDKVRLVSKEYSEMEDEFAGEMESSESENASKKEIRFYEFLQEARRCTFAILQDRERSADVRMALALAMSHDLQRRLQLHEVKPLRYVLKRYQNPMVTKKLEKKTKQCQCRKEQRQQIMSKMLRSVSKLTVLNPLWKEEIKSARKKLKSLNSTVYLELFEEFRNDMKDFGWDMMLEQLLCYFTGAYFCTAIYDGQLYAKMKFTTFSCLVIQELLFLRWIDQGKHVEFEDVVNLTYRYSREMEHLDENLNSMDELMSKKRGYRLEELLIAIQA